MGGKELRDQNKLIAKALAEAGEADRRRALDGTIGDTQSFCWAALQQFERRQAPLVLSAPKDFGRDHAELHMLLVVADDTVSHVKVLEQLLCLLQMPQTLPPDQTLRDRLREARNLLAAHRDERVLYWRLTSRHTPHVIERYKSLGVDLPQGPIDTEVLGYYPLPGATSEEIEEGLSTIGIVGGLLSLHALHDALKRLDADLAALARQHQSAGKPPAR